MYKDVNILKTLLTGISKAWVGMNGNVTQEISLSNHTHSNYVTSSQVETIVKEAMDVVKLVDTEGMVTDKEKSTTVTVNLADYVIIRGMAYIKAAANSEGHCSDYHLICAKDGTANISVPVDNYICGLNVSFDGTTVTIGKSGSYIIKATVEAYKYQ